MFIIIVQKTTESICLEFFTKLANKLRINIGLSSITTVSGWHPIESRYYLSNCKDYYS